MRHTADIGRLCMMAAGLAAAAAMASIPRVAAADPIDWATAAHDAATDLVTSAAATADVSTFDPNNFAVSIDGIPLFQVGSAHATSGFGDIAIADGALSHATALGGFGDFASADGFHSTAVAGDGSMEAGNNFDSASAVGDTAAAEAGLNGGSFDSASAVGRDAISDAGFGNNFDSASVWGSLTTVTSLSDTASAVQGSDDLAFVIDPFGTIGSQALAGFGGNFDIAGALADDLHAESIASDFLAHILPLF